MAMTTALDARAQLRRLVEAGETRRLRESAGLTMREAARHCGDVDPTAIMHWERGTRTPRGRNLRAYAQLLDQLAALEAGNEGGVPAAQRGT